MVYFFGKQKGDDDVFIRNHCECTFNYYWIPAWETAESNPGRNEDNGYVCHWFIRYGSRFTNGIKKSKFRYSHY